jgi:hypothetical protein
MFFERLNGKFQLNNVRSPKKGQTMSRILILAVLVRILSGCATVPSQEGRVSSAAYVGDRDSVQLDEIVVSVPKQGDDTSIRNLHVFFAAIINPTRTSTAQVYEVGNIIQRVHTRIAAQLVDDVTSGRIDTSKGLADIRSQLLTKATKIFAPVYSTWSHSEDLRVEIVVTSLFFTNGSVSKSASQNRFW